MEDNNENIIEGLKTHILDQISCPACLDIIRFGNIYTCEHGHIICQYCLTTVENNASQGSCVVCKSCYYVSRNRPLEKIRDGYFELFQTSCANSENGCQFKAFHSELMQHDHECPYKTLMCFNNGKPLVKSLVLVTISFSFALQIALGPA